jgi:hypothetical protein
VRVQHPWGVTDLGEVESIQLQQGDVAKLRPRVQSVRLQHLRKGVGLFTRPGRRHDGRRCGDTQRCAGDLSVTAYLNEHEHEMPCSSRRAYNAPSGIYTPDSFTVPH